MVERHWRASVEEVGLTINDLFLPDRDSILIPFLSLLLRYPCLAYPALPVLPAPTAITSSDYITVNKFTNINSNAAIHHIFLAPPSPSHIMTPLILPLLRCPLCPSDSTLTAPVTLYCGHTVCAIHVSLPAHAHRPSSSPQPHTHLPTILLRLTPCPIQGCTATPATSPPHLNVPSSSHVTFFPAVGDQPDQDASAFATIPDPRIDVTVNNLATIIHRYDQQLHAQSPQHLPSADSGSGSDSQTDDEILDTRASSPTREGPSSIPRQVSSDRAQQCPDRTSARKRRRKGLPPPRRRDAPAQSADQFEKELLAELSCEICLTLYYQPITTPCQHVSLPIPLPSFPI